MQNQPPRVFNYSLDWRFLLPIADVANTLVLYEEDADFSQTLAHIGIPASNQSAPGEVKRGQGRTVDAVALPFGIPVQRVGPDAEAHVELYRSLRRLIEPGGHFLIGFNNAGYGRRTNAKYYPAKPRRIVTQLRQAGYRSVEILGVMPDLSIPEYILHLDPESILFALRHRFRRQPLLLKVLRAFSYSPGFGSMSSFLPCYFAVAVA